MDKKYHLVVGNELAEVSEHPPQFFMFFPVKAHYIINYVYIYMYKRTCTLYT